jgi:hypothetical protein
VWVTVVATGYGDGRPRRRESEKPGIGERERVSERPRPSERVRISDRNSEPRRTLREPAGEPRVTRRERSYGSSGDLDVPEFIPRR